MTGIVRKRAPSVPAESARSDGEAARPSPADALKSLFPAASGRSRRPRPSDLPGAIWTSPKEGLPIDFVVEQLVGAPGSETRWATLMRTETRTSCECPFFFARFGILDAVQKADGAPARAEEVREFDARLQAEAGQLDAREEALREASAALGAGWFDDLDADIKRVRLDMAALLEKVAARRKAIAEAQKALRRKDIIAARTDLQGLDIAARTGLPIDLIGALESPKKKSWDTAFIAELCRTWALLTGRRPSWVPKAGADEWIDQTHDDLNFREFVNAAYASVAEHSEEEPFGEHQIKEGIKEFDRSPIPRAWRKVEKPRKNKGG
jgi:hypothetical protein